MASEPPRPGLLLAIDAEFVALTPLSDLKRVFDSSGDQVGGGGGRGKAAGAWGEAAAAPAAQGEAAAAAATKVARLSLARVSVVRAEGPQAGQPCIDDHVRAVEPVHDYLTRYRCGTPSHAVQVRYAFSRGTPSKYTAFSSGTPSRAVHERCLGIARSMPPFTDGPKAASYAAAAALSLTHLLRASL